MLNRAGCQALPRYFRNAMINAGYTAEQANEELPRLFAAPGQVYLRDYYLVQVRRTGATFCLNRAERARIYDSLCGAINMVIFDSEVDGSLI